MNIGILERLVTQALRRGFDTLEVEYRDGFEEVCGFKGGVGIEIARVRSSTPEGAALRHELYSSLEKAPRVTLDDGEFRLRSQVWDSFGEDAFRVTLQPVRRSALRSRRGNLSGDGPE